MAQYIRTCPSIDPAPPVLLPGDRERAEVIRLSDGPISVDGPTWQAMRAAAGADIAVPVNMPD
jgi:hypothetical protein